MHVNSDIAGYSLPLTNMLVSAVIIPAMIPGLIIGSAGVHWRRAEKKTGNKGPTLAITGANFGFIPLDGSWLFRILSYFIAIKTHQLPFRQ